MKFFNKILNKILLGYGIFILIILVQLLLIYIVTNRADHTFTDLSKDIKPKLDLITKYKTANRELYLLINNKVLNQKNTLNNNKIKRIKEVEFPYFRERLKELKSTSFTNSFYTQPVDSILKSTQDFEKAVTEINTLLFTSRDYTDPNKLDKAKQLLNFITNKTTNIDYNLTFLQRDFQKKSEESFINLTEIYENSKYILLIATIFFIILGLIFSRIITKPIVASINSLMVGAKNISKGNYSNKINVIGKDEIAELTNIFNEMAKSLDANFNEIKKKNKQLEQFTYIASHDLQEPLKTINGFVNILIENYGNKFDEVGQKSLLYINEASDRMSLLVKNLLDHNRIGKQSTLIETDCNILVNNVLKDLGLSIEESNAKIIVKKLPTIKCYPVELGLLFQNLISNALKFRKDNTPLKIDVSVEKNEGYTFSIKDNGIGFDPKFSDEIFKVFRRLNFKNEYPGTGIGLAHCKKIVELHNGTIWATSEPNKGSTFHFKIAILN